MDIEGFLRTLTPDFLETKFKWQFIDKYFCGFERSKLKNKNFSIICNNCVGGGIYHKLGMQYTSPTIGLFFFSNDYIKFLESFDYYIKQPLRFKTTSFHRTIKEFQQNTQPYPIGVLDDEIEIHFLHYHNEKEALEKWNRRTRRLNFDNLFFIYSDGGGGVAGAGGYDFLEEFFERYERLPFQYKIFFSSKPRWGKCSVFLPEYLAEMHVGNSACNRKYEKYVDVVKWLNGEKDFVRKKNLSIPNVYNK